MIFDKKPIQVLNATSLFLSIATIPQLKLLQSSNICSPFSIKILNEVLQNDRGDRFDHFHILINTSPVNTNSSLTLLACN